MKKKTIVIVAVIALVALAVPAVAFANAMPHAWMGMGQSARVQPVLADQTVDSTRGGYVDADQDGVCDNRVDGRGVGSGYVDADGNGVCDNRASGYAPRAPAMLTPTAMAFATLAQLGNRNVRATSMPTVTESATTAVLRRAVRAKGRALVRVAEPVAVTGPVASAAKG